MDKKCCHILQIGMKLMKQCVRSDLIKLGSIAEILPRPVVGVRVQGGLGAALGHAYIQVQGSVETLGRASQGHALSRHQGACVENGGLYAAGKKQINANVIVILENILIF